MKIRNVPQNMQAVFSFAYVNLQAPCVLYIGTGVSLLSRERFLYI